MSLATLLYDVCDHYDIQSKGSVRYGMTELTQWWLNAFSLGNSGMAVKSQPNIQRNSMNRLRGLSFILVYDKGKENIVADTFSQGGSLMARYGDLVVQIDIPNSVVTNSYALDMLPIVTTHSPHGVVYSVQWGKVIRLHQFGMQCLVSEQAKEEQQVRLPIVSYLFRLPSSGGDQSSRPGFCAHRWPGAITRLSCGLWRARRRRSGAPTVRGPLSRGAAPWDGSDGNGAERVKAVDRWRWTGEPERGDGEGGGPGDGEGGRRAALRRCGKGGRRAALRRGRTGGGDGGAETEGGRAAAQRGIEVRDERERESGLRPTNRPLCSSVWL
jgi:hypothetical protein